MAWFETLSAFMPVAWFARGNAQDQPAAPSRKDLQNPQAFVDPSRLLANWKQAQYNPGWLATRKGLAVVDTMRRDEQVKAAYKFKVDTVLGTGWEVVSPAGEDYDWEVTEFVRDTLERLEGGLQAALNDMMLALLYGFSVQERIYWEQPQGEWKGKLALRRLQALRPHWVDFVVDEFGQLHGITQQLTAGVPQMGHGANNPLPPGKFVVYTYQREFGNFYGVSDLEACYRSWWVKDNAYKWLAVTLERFGMPPLFAMYDPNQYQGGQIEELKKVVKGIQNATLGVLPRATKEALEMWSQDLGKGSTDLFLAALERFDQHIARALLVPVAVGMSGESRSDGSLARSQQHFDSFIRTIEALRMSVAVGVMNGQVIPQLCDLNFPNLDSYPVFRFLPFSDDKKLEAMTTWLGLVGGKVVNRIEDDEQHIRKVLGFPENEDVVIEPLPEFGTDGVPNKRQLGGPPGVPGAAPPGGRPGARGAPPDGAGAALGTPRKVPAGEQTAEMRAFAAEHDAEWVELPEGERVCVEKEFELCKDCSGSTAPTCLANKECLGASNMEEYRADKEGSEWATVDGHEGVWRTVNGRKVFIRKGESLLGAMRRAEGRSKKAKGERPYPRVMPSLYEPEADEYAVDWDESKHPRQPTGSEKGGEFAPAGAEEITKDGNRLGFVRKRRLARFSTQRRGGGVSWELSVDEKQWHSVGGTRKEAVEGLWELASGAWHIDSTGTLIANRR